MNPDQLSADQSGESERAIMVTLLLDMADHVERYPFRMSLDRRVRWHSPDNIMTPTQIRRAAELLERADRLLAALRQYGRHSDWCGDADAYNHADIPRCGCGLDAALEDAAA